MVSLNACFIPSFYIEHVNRNNEQQEENSYELQ